MEANPVPLGDKGYPVDVLNSLRLLLPVVIAHCGEHEACGSKVLRHLYSSKAPINKDVGEVRQ